MKTLLRVIAQYIDENGKPKGGREFMLTVNSDLFLYEKGECVEVVKEMLADFSKEWAGEYTYLSHELVFHEPILLNSNKFEILMKEKFQARA